MQSCATFKSHKKKIICESTYIIMSVTTTDSEKPQVVCWVRDANDYDISPFGAKIKSKGITYGVVGMNRADWWDDRVKFEIPTGKHSISVDGGYSYDYISTDEIDFEPYTKTEILFELGKESMGLPCDYHNKSWKYKGPVY